MPLTPPLLVIELAVIVLVDASATGPVDVISMTPPVCPSLALPVNSTPPAPAFSTTRARYGTSGSNADLTRFRIYRYAGAPLYEGTVA